MKLQLHVFGISDASKSLFIVNNNARLCKRHKHNNHNGLKNNQPGMNTRISGNKWDPLCGLVVRVPGYRSRGPGFDSQHYQIFWEVVGLEQGPLSLVSTTEELSSGSGLERREYSRGDPMCWPRDTLYSQKLALTSPIYSARSVQFTHGLRPQRFLKWIYRCCTQWHNGIRCIVLGWTTAGIMGSNPPYDAPVTIVSPICSQMLGKIPNTDKKLQLSTAKKLSALNEP
jgi:hypothetical protein